MYTAIQKTWWWQCFNFPVFPLNRISNILSFIFVFPVLTQILQTMIFFTLSLCLGKGKSCLTAAPPEHTRMKTSRGVLHPCATAWKLQQEASSCCCWSAGHWGYTASSQAAHWDPLQLACRQNYIFCTLKEAFHPKPIPPPAPALMGTQNLHTVTMGRCHFGLPLNTPLLQLSLDKPVVHPSPAGTQLHSVLREGCKQNTKQNSTARAPTVKGGA